MFKKLKNCHNTNDFRLLAKQNLPSPIFHYIDGAADDEKTYVQNTQAFDRCDLVPSVLNSVSNIDTSVQNFFNLRHGVHGLPQGLTAPTTSDYYAL